jgi:hypothetical protein
MAESAEQIASSNRRGRRVGSVLARHRATALAQEPANQAIEADARSSPGMTAEAEVPLNDAASAWLSGGGGI